LCLEAQDEPLVALVDGDLFEAIEVADDVGPFGVDAGGLQALVEGLAQDEGKERTEQMSGNGGVALVEDRPGVEDRLGGLDSQTKCNTGMVRSCDGQALWTARSWAFLAMLRSRGAPQDAVLVAGLRSDSPTCAATGDRRNGRARPIGPPRPPCSMSGSGVEKRRRRRCRC
jgi:hypothetical protein